MTALQLEAAKVLAGAYVIFFILPCCVAYLIEHAPRNKW